MKIVGLITEYNPFHNGHLYHIEKAKELTGADAVIVVMSGDFVQRGAPAIMPKHLRAESALISGADLVIELPVYCASGSAEYFAAGAVSILDQLGCVDYLCFGSESGDIEGLKRLAYILSEEPEDFQDRLKQALKSGNSFPKARQKALAEYLEDEDAASLLGHPNNILGMEYIKALFRRKSRMNVLTIQRMVSDYHDEELKGTLSSASAIRKNILHTEFHDICPLLENQVPPSSLHLLQTAYGTRYPVCSDDFSLLLKYRLLTENRSNLAAYADITEELANRIANCSNDFINFDQFCELLKTKEITYSRVSRALFHLLLNIKKEDVDAYTQAGYCPYARILGFRRDASGILKEIKAHTSIPLITKLGQTEGLSDTGKRMLETDIFAANLYESVITAKFGTPFINEHQQSIVII